MKMEVVSLLYKNLKLDEESRLKGKNIFEDLNINEISSDIMVEPFKVETVHNIMLDSCSAEDIIFRQELIKDFFNIPELFPEFLKNIDLFVQLRKIMDDRKNSVVRTSRAGQNQNHHKTEQSQNQNKVIRNKKAGETEVNYKYNVEDSRALNFSNLITSCEDMSNIYKYICNMHGKLENFKVQSSAMRSFIKYMYSLVNDFSLDKMSKACDFFNEHANSHMNAGIIFDIDVHFNDLLHMLSMNVTNFRFAKPKPSTLVGSIANAIKRTDSKTSEIYVHKKYTYSCKIYEKDDYFFKGLIDDQIKSIVKRLTAVIDRLIGIFTRVNTEMLFYEYGIKLIEMMRRYKIPDSFPIIAEDNDFNADFVNLCDITVGIQTARNPLMSLVPNDFAFQGANKTDIVLGGNNGGKTTFLRSFGTALIFARCGLPVAAESATISLFDNFYTHFPRYDRDLKNEGQLNNELEEISDAVYNASPRTVILMNEAFSGTGTNDAIAISVDVLSALAHIGAKTLFVTHLTDLPKKLADCGRFNAYRAFIVHRMGQDENGNPTYKLEREII